MSLRVHNTALNKLYLNCSYQQRRWAGRLGTRSSEQSTFYSRGSAGTGNGTYRTCINNRYVLYLEHILKAGVLWYIVVEGQLVVLTLGHLHNTQLG